MKLEQLQGNPDNPRTITTERLKMLQESLLEFGDLSGFVYNRQTGQLCGGHQRQKVMPKDADVVVVNRYLPPSRTGTVADGYVMWQGERFTYREVDWDPVKEKAANIAANKHGGEFDDEKLAHWLKDLKDLDFNLELTGFTPAEVDVRIEKLVTEQGGGGGGPGEGKHGSLTEKFLVPPFSVLDARQGYWQTRKKEWLGLGIQSEIGREGNLLSEATPRTGYGSGYDTSKGENAWGGSGTSIFDPVVAELAYRWFCPKQGNIIDPFAGGSVRGIVASHLGRQYVGVDLSEKQVAANKAQSSLAADPQPVWLCGDSINIREHVKNDFSADLLFTCPPYVDLEVYSDDERDISNMAYVDFYDKYRRIIKETALLLKENRFAVIVVGEVRGTHGLYYSLVPDTVRAFQEAGLVYYNEAILVTAIGSLPLRAGKAFSSSRKLGKTHQNVLVFVKGDWKEAVKACGEVEIAPLPESEQTEGVA